jgi:hypothetical protein
MSRFIKACECPICGKLCKSDGITVDFTTEENVISLNSFSNESWHCDNCDIDFGICDIESIVEEF